MNYYQRFWESSFFFFRRMSSGDRDAEKERRLNANMIERRRMQNINLGFTSLKRLLPPTEKKQTKAAILQQAVQHILRLQRTVTQVRENNNVLRQNLADERKQNLALKKQLDVHISEKFTRNELQGSPFYSHMQLNGRPPTPPNEDHGDRAFNRWPVLHCGKVARNSSEYQAFDRFSLHESRNWGQVPVIVKREDAWEDNGNKDRHLVTSETRTYQDESEISYQESSAFSLSREFSEPGVFQRKSWGNNLHCIVDAINLIEKN